MAALILLIYVIQYLPIHPLFKQFPYLFLTSPLPFFWLLLTFSHSQLWLLLNLVLGQA